MPTSIRPPTTEEWLAIERELHERPSDTPSPSPLSGFLKFNMVSAFPVPSYRTSPSSASSNGDAGCEDSGFMETFEVTGQLDDQVVCMQDSAVVGADLSGQTESVEDRPGFECTMSSTIMEAVSTSSDWTNWFKHMGSDMGKILTD